MAIESHRIKVAKVFCEKYISKLEEYHSVYGQYPETVSLFQLGDRKPEFLDGQKVYEKTEDGFIVTFETPGSFIGLYVYDSKKGKWCFHDKTLGADAQIGRYSSESLDLKSPELKKEGKGSSAT